MTRTEALFRVTDEIKAWADERTGLRWWALMDALLAYKTHSDV